MSLTATSDSDAGVEGEESVSLRSWLLARKIPESVCDLLEGQHVSMQEIVTFTEEELVELCKDLNIGVINRKRFINAIKEIPNSVASITVIKNYRNVVRVFLGNEEKEQMNHFDTMTNEIKNKINTINDETKSCKKNFNDRKNKINQIYNEIELFIKQSKQNDLNKIAKIESLKMSELKKFGIEFQNTLKNTNKIKIMYDDYITMKSMKSKELNQNNDNEATITESKMNEEIRQCNNDYSKLMKQFDASSLIKMKMQDINCDISNVKMVIANLINLESIDNNSYSLCKFSDEFVSFDKNANNVQISKDRYLIQVVEREHHSVTLSSETGFYQNDNTNENGKHCWRMYLKYGYSGQSKWYLFGICQFGVRVGSNPWTHATTWGVSGNASTSHNQYHQNGQHLYDTKLSFLYENEIEQIDMLLDVNNGTLSYKIVKDDDNNAQEFTMIGLDTNLKWIPIFDLNFAGGKLQVAKIPVAMYGKKKQYVKWTVTY